MGEIFCKESTREAQDTEISKAPERPGQLTEECIDTPDPPLSPSSSQQTPADSLSDHPLYHIIQPRPSKAESATSGRLSAASFLSTDSSEQKSMAVLQAPGPTGLSVLPNKLDKAKLQQFRRFLSEHGIDHGSWGKKGTKTLEHLFWEAFVQRGCIITLCAQDAPLKRVTKIVKISIVAEIFGIDHTLQSRLQFLHDGQCIERKTLLVKRLQWAKNVPGTPDKPAVFDKIFEQEDCSLCQPWRQGVSAALQDRIGLSTSFQENHLEEVENSYSYRVEDKCQSEGFPGVTTLYCIHELKIRVKNPESPAVQCLGLPTGQEFATTEGDFNINKQMQHDDAKLPLGTQLNIWTWVRSEKVEGKPDISRCSSPNREHQIAQTTAVTGKSTSNTTPAASSVIKRVPLPIESARSIAIAQASISCDTEFVPPNSRLHIVKQIRTTNWEQAKRMAKRIADKDYSLKDFTEDLQAFPELAYYLLDSDGAGVTSSGSGRTLGDEFQRTIGAFYAIYWLLRLDSDGKDGFSFGVDDDWKAISPDEVPNAELEKPEKRLAFYKDSSWSNFQQLMVDADLLVEDSSGCRLNETRVLTILALTAIHDIMKVQALLPTVQEGHEPYHGYQVGDVIGDHDQALSYLMDHYPELIPSYAELEEDEKFSVAFTQCQLQFNQGWFVQAEAPPGAIFTKFKDVLIRDQKSKVKPRDIALYFVHWLTDLAGAEPTPLAGCEKFVVKFPLPVLNSFLRSFGFVEQLAHKTETEVMEEYLKMRWAEHTPDLGEIPWGKYGIVKMRLICMAQMNSVKILEGFEKLRPDDKEILSCEMSRTGCMSQTYSADLVPSDPDLCNKGPALLIYYGPAFLQSLGQDDATLRLSMLAEVYRAARELWPLEHKHSGKTVIVRIDTIKGLTSEEISNGQKAGKVWVLVKHNDLESFIELSSTSKLNKFIANRQALHVLEFHDSVADMEENDMDKTLSG